MGNSAIFGGNRYLVPFNRGIATTSVRTGLAMTENFGAKPLNTNFTYYLKSSNHGALRKKRAVAYYSILLRHRQEALRPLGLELLLFILEHIQLVIPPLPAQQLLVGSLLQNLPVGQEDDLVRVLDGA